MHVARKQGSIKSVTMCCYFFLIYLLFMLHNYFVCFPLVLSDVRDELLSQMARDSKRKGRVKRLLLTQTGTEVVKFQNESSPSGLYSVEIIALDRDTTCTPRRPPTRIGCSLSCRRMPPSRSSLLIRTPCRSRGNQVRRSSRVLRVGEPEAELRPDVRCPDEPLRGRASHSSTKRRFRISVGEEGPEECEETSVPSSHSEPARQRPGLLRLRWQQNVVHVQQDAGRSDILHRRLCG